MCEDVDCQSKKTFYTSKISRSDAKQGPKQEGTPFEINQIMALAMRLLGRGLDGLTLFAAGMNMATPSDQTPAGVKCRSPEQVTVRANGSNVNKGILLCRRYKSRYCTNAFINLYVGFPKDRGLPKKVGKTL